LTGTCVNVVGRGFEWFLLLVMPVETLKILNRMVKYRTVADTLALVYSALGDPTRRGIVERLARGEMTVADIRRPLQMSAPAVSKHLRVLEHAGLVRRRRSGRHQVFVLRGSVR
jgi:DNA-binding MarR family transcriptional regulator